MYDPLFTLSLPESFLRRCNCLSLQSPTPGGSLLFLTRSEMMQVVATPLTRCLLFNQHFRLTLTNMLQHRVGCEGTILLLLTARGYVSFSPHLIWLACSIKVNFITDCVVFQLGQLIAYELQFQFPKLILMGLAFLWNKENPLLELLNLIGLLTNNKSWWLCVLWTPESRCHFLTDEIRCNHKSSKYAAINIW